MKTSKTGALAACALFSSLPPISLAKIADLCLPRSFDKGESLFQEGDKAVGFFVVETGRVKVSKLSASGTERVLHLVGPGGSIAEAVVFGRLSVYPAFADALTAVTALFIPRDAFLGLLRSEFPLILSLLDSLTQRLRYFNDLLEELTLMSAEARLAKYLAAHAAARSGKTFDLGIRKVDLARRLGVAPETLSRQFKAFTRERLIRLEGRRVTILAPDRLEKIISGT